MGLVGIASIGKRRIIMKVMVDKPFNFFTVIMWRGLGMCFSNADDEIYLRSLTCISLFYSVARIQIWIFYCPHGMIEILKAYRSQGDKLHHAYALLHSHPWYETRKIWTA